MVVSGHVIKIRMEMVLENSEDEVSGEYGEWSK